MFERVSDEGLPRQVLPGHGVGGGAPEQAGPGLPVQDEGGARR